MAKEEAARIAVVFPVLLQPPAHLAGFCRLAHEPIVVRDHGQGLEMEVIVLRHSEGDLVGSFAVGDALAVAVQSGAGHGQPGAGVGDHPLGAGLLPQGQGLLQFAVGILHMLRELEGDALPSVEHPPQRFVLERLGQGLMFL